jgi:hypothetical protein
MKTLIKFAVAAIVALSAAVPAFASEPEGDVLSERNTYFFTPDARPIVQHQQNVDVRAHRGSEAQAFEPAQQPFAPARTTASDVRDFGTTGGY